MNLRFQPGGVCLPDSQYRDPESDHSRGWLLLSIALLLTGLVYGATLGFRFVYDDGPQIILNPTLTSWHSLPAFFRGNTWQFLVPDWAGNYYRPIFMTWLLMNRMAWGLNPVAWHAAAVCLHLVATTLAFLLARRLLGSGIQAGITAVIFGLHPIHIESVAWISGATDSLMAVFVFAAFLAWIRGQDSDQHLLWLILTALLYFLGCLSKETAFPLPFMVLVYTYLFQKDQTLWRSLVGTMPFWIVSVLYLILRSSALRGLAHLYPTPIHEVVLSLPLILWEYIRRLIYPVGLSLFYDLPPVTTFWHWRFWIPFAVLVGAAILISRARARFPIEFFSISWILFFLAPAMLGVFLFPIGEWVHDRYLYLPCFGLCLLLGRSIGKLRSDFKMFSRPAAPLVVTAPLTVALSFGTAWQQQYWANSLLLYVRSVNAAPRNPWAKGYLAGELQRIGDKANAARIYQEALELDPLNWKNNASYGLLLYELGDYRGADRFLTRAIDGDPTDPNAHYNQGMSRINYGNFAGAEISFREALQRNPKLSLAHYWLGYAMEKQGRTDVAIEQYEAEIRNHPENSAETRKRLEALERK